MKYMHCQHLSFQQFTIYHLASLRIRDIIVSLQLKAELSALIGITYSHFFSNFMGFFFFL